MNAGREMATSDGLGGDPGPSRGMIAPVTDKPTADDIRAGIRRAETAERRARAAIEKAREELIEWFRAAQDCREIPIQEAGELAGISRARVYEILSDADARARAAERSQDGR